MAHQNRIKLHAIAVTISIWLSVLLTVHLNICECFYLRVIWFDCITRCEPLATCRQRGVAQWLSPWIRWVSAMERCSAEQEALKRWPHQCVCRCGSRLGHIIFHVCASSHACMRARFLQHNDEQHRIWKLWWRQIVMTTTWKAHDRSVHFANREKKTVGNSIVTPYLFE